MGDLITQTTHSKLCYVPRSAFDDLFRFELEPEERVPLFACLARLNTLYMVAKAGSGHLGSSLSSLDIVSWLYLQELALPEAMGKARTADADVYFSSKGHDAPGLYSVLLGLGLLPFDKLHQLRRLGGLPGHPEVSTPHIATNTGSLGMGISKAKGMLFARRLQGRGGRVYVMTGDGELQEGQIWESLSSAANDRLSGLTVIVDHNKLQSDSWVAQTSDLGSLETKFAAFGWHVQRVDGHDLTALRDAFATARRVQGQPQVIIADTIKGCGVSFMEGTALDSDTALYRFHSGAPCADDYSRAVAELRQTLERLCSSYGLAVPSVAHVESSARPSTGQPEQLIAAYSRALEAELQRTPRAVVLDADLLVDTGQLPAKRAFPHRHIECGIAEMDMVSQAGGMALEGLLPICHSFVCFLSTRPNEQIYNNATERTKVVYVASLAGVLPGGPGHSHQGVRDIATVGTVPDLIMLEPATERDVAAALHFALHETRSSVYLRLVSMPWEVPVAERMRSSAPLKVGVGRTLREGTDAIVFAYGPVLLGEALRAASRLEDEGIRVGVIDMPWLNRVEQTWFAACAARTSLLLFLDNHLEQGGQGDLLCSALARLSLPRRVKARKLGVKGVPVCGTADEVLARHGLDATAIANLIRLELERGQSPNKTTTLSVAAPAE